MNEGKPKKKKRLPQIEPGAPKKLSVAPDKEKDIDELANKLIDWVYTHDVYNLADFPLSLKMSPLHFYRCAEKSSYFEDAISVAKYVISSRILKGWREGTILKEYAHNQLYQYDLQYKNAYSDARLIDRKAMTETLGGGGTRFIIEAPAIPDSNKVKKLERNI